VSGADAALPSGASPRVVLQYFEGCPGWQTATDRPLEALRLAGMGKLEIQLQKVADRIGFGGSPTILFDGVDLFADASPSVGYACRLYRTAAGAEGAPSLSQLTERLAEAWQR
jgi:hypothetical protein